MINLRARKTNILAFFLVGTVSIYFSQQTYGADNFTDRTAIDSFVKYMAARKNLMAKSRKISTPNGIDVTESLQINGLKQWFRIRGTNKDNPVLLYLHGGPGSASMPFSYAMSSQWEEEFIMVHWDQRGTGKTRCSNPEYDPKTAQFEDFYTDMIEVITYLKKRLNKKKIIVLGHSWGTLLGTHLAKRNPELLHAYVGTGQMTNTIESETLGYEFALQQATENDDKEGVKRLKSIAPYPSPVPVGTKELQRQVSTQRKYLQKYGGAVQFSYMEKIYKAFFRSPDYSICDWMGFIDTQLGGTPYPHRDLTGSFLDKEGGLANFDQDIGFKFKVPMFFFLGALDYQTSTIIATRYFDKIQAPHKQLIIFEKSGHAPPQTEEKKFVDSLVKLVRPFALKP
ncbi:MAG: hypothetical protein COB36_10530 [Alphaproteobacteria bacterium]|nr:MAG: hypothetical protein COB36_10530 [Alphaproteobacteria bacterium]